MQRCTWNLCANSRSNPLAVLLAFVVYAVWAQYNELVPSSTRRLERSWIYTALHRASATTLVYARWPV